MKTEIIKEYEIRVESVVSGSDEPIIMHSVYAKDGGYVGTVKDFFFFLEQEIMPELSPLNLMTCSIGKSLKDGKWYGWSHRAIQGFAIGDIVKEGDCAASSGYTQEYLDEHPEENHALPVGFKAETEADTKKMAISFASSVS